MFIVKGLLTLFRFIENYQNNIFNPSPEDLYFIKEPDREANKSGSLVNNGGMNLA